MRATKSPVICRVAALTRLKALIVAIPKSTDAGRIAENFDVFGFSLDGDEVVRIDSLPG